MDRDTEWVVLVQVLIVSFPSPHSMTEELTARRLSYICKDAAPDACALAKRNACSRGVCQQDATTAMGSSLLVNLVTVPL